VKDENEKFIELLKRKETVLKTIEEQELLTPELKARIENCYDPVELEDIYLPYKPKRKTKASVAREKGLEPLAKIIMKQFESNIELRAASFINDQVDTVEDALSGARDIIAEWVNENERARNMVRQAFSFTATISSKVVKGKEEEGIKYRDYYEWQEPLKRCPSHRLLAMRRGENEGFLKIAITPENDKVIEGIEKFFIKSYNECAHQIELAIKDAYKRLLEPSIETEFANSSKEKADEAGVSP